MAASRKHAFEYLLVLYIYVLDVLTVPTILDASARNFSRIWGMSTIAMEASALLQARNSPAARVANHRRMQAQISELLAKDVFFIGGFPKSGTTWLQIMLNGHPEIACTGEGHFLDHFGPLLQAACDSHNKHINTKNESIFTGFAPFPLLQREDLDHLLVSAMALALLRTREQENARVIGEKTPDNLLHFSGIEALLPEAKFIHMVRDGRDCAVSAWFHNLRVAPQEVMRQHGDFQHFAEAMADQWRLWVELGLHYAATRPGRCMIIRYEDLSARPHDTLKVVLRFLDVATDESILQDCVSEAAFEKMSGGRPRGIEDRSSFMRQGVPGNWHQHFTAQGHERFVAVAGAVMARLGYQW